MFTVHMYSDACISIIRVQVYLRLYIYLCIQYNIYYNITYNRSTHFGFCSENIFQEGVKVKIIDTQNCVLCLVPPFLNMNMNRKDNIHDVVCCGCDVML